MPIRIADMTTRDTQWWDREITARHARLPERPDRFWVWFVLLPALHLIQLQHKRFCRPLVIWARADNGRFVRVAMSFIIERYVHLDVAHTGEAHFMWFMNTADKRILIEHFQMSNPPSLGGILLDNAMVLSANAGLQGRLGLHAAPAGGPELLQFYQRLALRRLAADLPLPKPIRRRNDGRYFYADEAVAANLVAAHNRFR